VSLGWWIVVVVVVGLLLGLAVLTLLLMRFSGLQSREEELEHARRRAWSVHDPDDDDEEMG